MTETVQILTLLKDAGAIGVLILALVGGWRGVYVWRWQYEELMQDRNTWREIGLKAVGMAERIVPK